jgi:hypothetical protein
MRLRLLSTAILIGTASLAGSAQIAPTTPERKDDSPPHVDVPAKTRLLLRFIAPVHSTSSTGESGVYLEIAFPVVSGTQILLPVGTKVQGTVANVRRPGRLGRHAQLRIRYTTLVLPDHSLVPIDGRTISIPGAKRAKVKPDGTVEIVDQIDQDVKLVVGGAALGALLGHRYPEIAAPAGAGAGAATALYLRGNDIDLNAGSLIEVILDSPVRIPASAVQRNADESESRQTQETPKGFTPVLKELPPPRREDLLPQ